MAKKTSRSGSKLKPIVAPLAPVKLRHTCDSARFKFKSTAELKPPKDILGQERAIDAIELGTGISHDGFNLFVLGAHGCDMQGAVEELLQTKARRQEPPCDWVYLYNFAAPDKPKAMCLPAGKAVRFRAAMETMVADIRATAKAMFEADEYQTRRRSIESGVKQAQETAFSELQKKSQGLGTAVLHTPQGFGVAPVKEGEVLKPEEFQALPQEEKDRIEQAIRTIQHELEVMLQGIPGLMTEARRSIQKLDLEFANAAIAHVSGDLEMAFSDVEGMRAYLDAVKTDLAENIYMFLASSEMPGQAEAEVAGPMQPQGDDPRLRRYSVNVVVSSDGAPNGRGAPIVKDERPSLANLVGRVEHQSQMGALITDFTLIKPGSLHHANGGYLLIDARKLLMQPFAWDALKRSLKTNHITIESATEYAGMFSPVSLEPEPIPLSVKVVLFGDHMLYFMLAAQDPEFSEFFKVEAEFDDVLKRARSMETRYAAWIGALAACNNVRALDPGGVAAVIEHSSRMADDSERLSLRGEHIADLLREADYWSDKAGRRLIGACDIESAIDGRKRRSDRIRERQMEAIERDIVSVRTSGAVVGQINGLSVLSMGDIRFGKPSRVTARIQMGSGKVVDIEREVALGGALHSKGVLILSSFITSRYAPGVPLSFGASLVFEQSYGGVDGDSASSTELYALLSALSGLPIKQSFAVTGSVSQLGEVQTIGGVNDKIEGYFDLCTSRGLTGEQGVLIPHSNVQHLMLRSDVVEACAKGRFHIYPIRTIDQGIETLTGVPAGKRGRNGQFPQGSVNQKVEQRLIGLADARSSYGKDRDNNDNGDAA